VHSLDSSSGSSGGNGSNGSNGAAAGMRVPRLEGDFSLNAANMLSADLLLRSGLSRLCPTYDLNVSCLRLAAAAAAAAAAVLETSCFAR
jgi:hypothetical protein